LSGIDVMLAESRNTVTPELSELLNIEKPSDVYKYHGLMIVKGMKNKKHPGIPDNSTGEEKPDVLIPVFC
jgi:hypothetical protein